MSSDQELMRRMQANEARWRQHSSLLDELAAMLASDGWSQAAVTGLVRFNEEQLAWANDVLDQLALLIGTDDPIEVLRDLSQRERDQCVLAGIHRAIAVTAAALMQEAASRCDGDPKAAQRAACEAYLDIWSMAPILTG